MSEPAATGEPSSAPTGAPAPVTAAIAGAAQQLGAAPDALALVSYEAVDWPDACLGVVVPGVMCAAGDHSGLPDRAPGTPGRV